EPATVYYYRFAYVQAGHKNKRYLSRVGRTKTAPAPESDVAVKFGVVTCQDFIGRFYNSYVAMTSQELDFWVHLGDYIYETTGDPSSENNTAMRAVASPADDPGISFGTYAAARSLGNYRQLWQTYRSDKNLQRMHELAPVVVVWDDHEYSND